MPSRRAARRVALLDWRNHRSASLARDSATQPTTRRDQPPGGWQRGGSSARDHAPRCGRLVTGAPRLDRPHHPLGDWAARRGHEGSALPCAAALMAR